MQIQGKLVFDIGANDGSLTSSFLLHGAEKVIAVEPQLHCVHQLYQRFDSPPERDKRVVILHAAIDRAPGFKQIWRCDTSSGLSWLD